MNYEQKVGLCLQDLLRADDLRKEKEKKWRAAVIEAPTLEEVVGGWEFRKHLLGSKSQSQKIKMCTTS